MHSIPLVESSEPALLIPLDDAAAQALAQVWLDPDDSRRRTGALRLLRESPVILWWAFFSVQREDAATSCLGSSAAESWRALEDFESWLRHFPARRQLVDFVTRDALVTLSAHRPVIRRQVEDGEPIEGRVHSSPATASPGDSSPTEIPPAAAAPAVTSPAENSSAETSPAETSPAETSPAETSPAETSPVEMLARALATGTEAERLARLPGGTLTEVVLPEETQPEEAQKVETPKVETQPEEAQLEEGQPAKAQPGLAPGIRSFSLPRDWLEPTSTSTVRMDPPELTFWFVLGVLSWSDDWLAIHDRTPTPRTRLVPSPVQQRISRLPVIRQARESVSPEGSTEVRRSVAANQTAVTSDPLEAGAGANREQAPAWLSMLASKLLRLEQLEYRFQQELHEAKMRALKEFAYGASHEINNPLANISTRAQTLLRDEVDPDKRWQLATINSQAFRAHEMISNAMLFAHPPKLDVRELDLVPLLEKVRAELLDVADAQGTRIELDLPCDAALLVGDEVQLGNAIKNVLQNSLEAVAQGGRVQLQLSVADKERYTLRMQDTGPGVPEPIRAHLFDPFFSGREAGRGLGLGLSKAWTIFSLHGGTIELEASEPHARFVIHIPKTPQASI